MIRFAKEVTKMMKANTVFANMSVVFDAYATGASIFNSTMNREVCNLVGGSI